MAFPSTFQERLQKMEATRSQRLLLLQVTLLLVPPPPLSPKNPNPHPLVLLQAEKELQLAKSQLLSKKIEDLRREECRCLLLKRRGTELACQILASKSEIDALEARHQAAACEYRDLKREIEELEEKEKTRDEFYNARMSELEEFKESTRRFLLDNREKVQKLQDSVSEGNDGYINNGRIAAAETKKSELLAEKEKLEKYLISSDYLRTLLQKQLHKMLISQGKKKNKALTEDRVEN